MLKRGYQLFRAAVRLRSFFWARSITAANVPTKALTIASEGRELMLGGGAIRLLGSQDLPLLHSYPSACELVDCASGRFFHSDSGDLFLSIDGITIGITSAEEIYIAHEIFVRGVYNFVTTQEAVVWDIGMNVGIASLFLRAS